MDSLQDLVITLTRLADPTAIIDVLLVAGLIYALLYLMRGTPAIQLVRGIIVVIAILFFLVSVLPLPAFRWLVERSIPALLIGVPVIFQPEIRRGLERLGRTGFRWTPARPTMRQVIQHVARATQRLSERHYGALIVFERTTGLQEFIETGVSLDAALTPELLLTIFHPGTALHDGAVIVRGDRVAAAACVLPLAAQVPDPQMGTRHRAALGITEQTDAVAVIVSEETGTISLAYGGRMIRHLDEGRLARSLLAFFEPGIGVRREATKAVAADADGTMSGP